MSSNIDFETQKYLSGIFTPATDWVVDTDRAEAYGPFVFLKIILHKQTGMLVKDEHIGTINNTSLIPKIAGKKLEMLSLTGGLSLANMSKTLYGWLGDTGDLYGTPSSDAQISYVMLMGMFFRDI